MSLGSISIKNLKGTQVDILIYDIDKIKEGEGGGFLFDFGDGAQGTKPKPCRVIKLKSGDKILTSELIDEIKIKIVAARNNEDFNAWLKNCIDED